MGEVSAKIAHEQAERVFACVLPVFNAVCPLLPGQDVQFAKVNFQVFVTGYPFKETLSRFDIRVRNDESNVVNVSKITVTILFT